MPIPRIPPDKTQGNSLTNLTEKMETPIPNETEIGRNESLERQGKIDGSARIPHTPSGKFMGPHTTTRLHAPALPDLPNPTDNDTVDSDTCIFFNDTEAILRLSDDLKPMKPSHRFHYDTRTNTEPNDNDPRPQKSEQAPPQHIPKMIQRLLTSRNEIYDPVFRFETTRDAAQHNLKLLRDHEFNLEKICNQGQRTILRFGSEFKDTGELNQLLKYHPRWQRLKHILTHGVDFNLH